MSATDALGLAIPDELSLIGVGDTELVRLSKPPITAVRWDIALCGRWAAEMMLERLRHGDEKRPYRMLEVPTEMVLRRNGPAPILFPAHCCLVLTSPQWGDVSPAGRSRAAGPDCSGVAKHLQVHAKAPL